MEQAVWLMPQVAVPVHAMLVAEEREWRGRGCSKIGAALIRSVSSSEAGASIQRLGPVQTLKGSRAAPVEDGALHLCLLSASMPAGLL